jgi:hypothetical protein
MYKNIYILLIDLDDMKLYSVLRMLSYICTQSPFPLFFPPLPFIKYMYTFTIYVTCFGNKLYQLSTSTPYNNVIHINMKMTASYIYSKCIHIFTRLRHPCSSLGADLFRANIVNDPRCPCGCPLGDAIHYLLECSLTNI